MNFRGICNDPSFGINYELQHVQDYYPYGESLRKYVASSGQEKFLSTQHERDSETGFDYRGARFYDAECGRFLSLDPLAMEFAAWSPYNYVFGNPITLIDPTGGAPEPPDHFNFLSTSGLSIYRSGRSNGFSAFGSVFVLAQASLETGWGQSPGAEINNFFSIMGGSSDVQTSHGTLRSYGSLEEGFTDYYNLLERRWPSAITLLEESSFSGDQANEAFNTGPYQKYPAYFVPRSGENSDYGGRLIRQMSGVWTSSKK